MIELYLAPEAETKLLSLHRTLPHIAETIEDCLLWIKSDDPRSRRRKFANGLWVISRSIAGSEWVIVWDQLTPGITAVRFIGESSSF